MMTHDSSDLSKNDDEQQKDSVLAPKEIPSQSLLFKSKNRLDQRLIFLDSLKSKGNKSKAINHSKIVPEANSPIAVAIKSQDTTFGRVILPRKRISLEVTYQQDKG